MGKAPTYPTVQTPQPLHTDRTLRSEPPQKFGLPQTQTFSSLLWDATANPLVLGGERELFIQGNVIHEF